MLGQWTLGEDALGSYPSTEGTYLYAVNLSVALASAGSVKRGISFLPVYNLNLGQTATRKFGAKLAVSNGVSLAESAVVKAGVKFAALNNVALGVSASKVVRWNYPGSFLNSTLGITTPVKAGRKLAVVNSVTLALPTTLKVGVKARAANAWQLGLSTIRLVGWKPPSALGNLQLGISAGFTSAYTYGGLAGVEISADFLYNQAYLLAQLNTEISLELGIDSRYRAEFWSPSVVVTGDWSKAVAVENDWSKASAPDGAWAKQGQVI